MYEIRDWSFLDMVGFVFLEVIISLSVYSELQKDFRKYFKKKTKRENKGQRKVKSDK